MCSQSAPGTKAPAVVKAVTVLDDLARSAGAGSISEIARRIGAPKSSVADICATLATLGLLSRDREGRYLLGHHIIELARGLVGGRRLIEVFSEACDTAPEVRDETVTLSILDGADIVIVAARNGRTPLPVTARIGLRLPSWATASGRCFLGALPDADVAAILKTGSATSAGVYGSPPSARQLIADLAVERERGFYVDDQSTAKGMTSFGAPIEGGSGGVVVAAVAIALRTDSLLAASPSAMGAAVRHVAETCKHLAASPENA